MIFFFSGTILNCKSLIKLQVLCSVSTKRTWFIWKRAVESHQSSVSKLQGLSFKRTQSRCQSRVIRTLIYNWCLQSDVRVQHESSLVSVSSLITLCVNTVFSFSLRNTHSHAVSYCELISIISKSCLSGIYYRVVLGHLKIALRISRHSLSSECVPGFVFVCWSFKSPEEGSQRMSLTPMKAMFPGSPYFQ